MNGYERQSFSCRICDDLCLIILKHLELQDFIQLRCTSKQFQYCFRQSIHVLKNCRPVRNVFEKNRISEFVDLLPNLRAIKFNLCLRPRNYESLFQVITAKCDKIVEICCDWNGLSRDIMIKFIDKLCNSLRKICFLTPRTDFLIQQLIRCPALECLELRWVRVETLFNYAFAQTTGMPFKLKRISFEFTNGSTEFLHRLVASSTATLCSISVSINVYVTINEIENLVSVIKTCRRLRCLRVTGKVSPVICVIFRALTEKDTPALRSFSVTLIGSETMADIHSIVLSKNFLITSVKCLIINLRRTDDEENSNFTNIADDDIRVDLLRMFPNVGYLILNKQQQNIIKPINK